MIGLFSGLGASADSFVNSFVVSVSTNVSLAIAPLVTAGFSIWFMIYGYAVMRNEVNDPINVFVKNAIKNTIIASIAIGCGMYQEHIIGFVYGIQDGLVSVVMKPIALTSASGGNIMEVIDSLAEKGDELAIFMLAAGSSKLPVGGYLDLGAGVVVAIANTALMLICGCYAMLAKVALAIILALGPIFIAALAFPATQRFFDSWFSKIMNYVFLTLILGLGIGFAIGVADSYTMNAIKEIGSLDPTNRVLEAFNFAALYLALIFVIYQSTQLASGLAGGAALSGGGLGQFVMGVLSRGKSQSSTSSAKAENSIEQGKGTGGGARGIGGSGGSSVPAYKRAAMRKFGARK